MPWTHHPARGSPVTGARAPDATLASLLDTEREMAALLERADFECAALLAAAQGAVTALEAAAAQGTDAVLRSLDAEDAAAMVRDRQALEAEARALVQRCDGLPDETIQALAGAVLRDFLGIAALGEGSAP